MEICKFIDWGTEGKVVMFKNQDLMSCLNNSLECRTSKQFYGIYPNNIPMQNNCGKRVKLEVRECVVEKIKFAFIEFTMNYYLFFEIPD